MSVGFPAGTSADITARVIGARMSQLLGQQFVVENKVGATSISKYDYNVNAQASAEWLYRLKAPAKRVVWFEQSAHMPFMEEPGKFLVELVSVVRPLAEKAGDSPPK